MSEELTRYSKLDEESKAITEQIIDEESIDELNNLLAKFNLNQKKRNIVRTEMLSRLMDKASVQMVERLDKHAGEFSNKDLLDYLATARAAIDKNNISIDSSDMKPLIAQQNNLNVNITTLSRESKERVSDAVRALLAKMSSGVSDMDFSDFEEE